MRRSSGVAVGEVLQEPLVPLVGAGAVVAVGVFEEEVEDGLDPFGCQKIAKRLLIGD